MKKFLGVIAMGVLACLRAAAQAQQPIRVNCGGPSYTDTKGQLWQADTGYNTGIASNNSVVATGTNDPALYQSNRYVSGSTPLICKFAVTNGAYRVNPLFSENYTGLQSVGARVFNVKLNGSLVLQNFDIFATVGANAAVVESFNTNVTNGQLAIEFDMLVQNPKINAIEILPLANSPMMTLKFTYADGTPVTGNLNYAMSTSLLTIGGQLPLVNGQATCVLELKRTQGRQDPVVLDPHEYVKLLVVDMEPNRKAGQFQLRQNDWVFEKLQILSRLLRRCGFAFDHPEEPAFVSSRCSLHLFSQGSSQRSCLGFQIFGESLAPNRHVDSGWRLAAVSVMAVSPFRVKGLTCGSHTLVVTRGSEKFRGTNKY